MVLELVEEQGIELLLEIVVGPRLGVMEADFRFSAVIHIPDYLDSALSRLREAGIPCWVSTGGTKLRFGGRLQLYDMLVRMHRDKVLLGKTSTMSLETRFSELIVTKLISKISNFSKFMTSKIWISKV